MWEHGNLNNDVEIQLPHIRLSGRCWGNKDKPLILALHGWLDNANSFAPLAKHLSQYQILAIDWPGHGYSEHRPGQYPLHWIDYLYDLEILIDYVNQGHTVHGVVGHSLGGIVASAYTAAFPERINKLVLLEAISPLYESVSKSRSRLTKSFASHLQFLKKSAQTQTVYKDIELAVKARSRLTGLDEQWCRLLVERNMCQHDNGVSWRSDPRLKLDSPFRMSFEQVDALMSGRNPETLLITAKSGYEQINTLLPQAATWFKSLSHIQLAGDHHLHMGNAQSVAHAIDDFMTN